MNQLLKCYENTEGPLFDKQFITSISSILKIMGNPKLHNARDIILHIKQESLNNFQPLLH